MPGLLLGFLRTPAVADCVGRRQLGFVALRFGASWFNLDLEVLRSDLYILCGPIGPRVLAIAGP